MTLREKIEGALFGAAIAIGLPALLFATQPVAG